MSTRAEPVVWVEAEPQIDLGDLAANLAALRQQTPSLAVLLATNSQTGTIRPELLAKLPPSERFVMQCQPNFDPASATRN
jgi:hypothetical protein